MQLKSTSVGKAGAQTESWLDRVIDRIKPQPSTPGSPAPPPLDQTQWERSVDAHKVNTLTVHDVGLIVFGETQSSRIVAKRMTPSVALVKKLHTW
jgi:hypothetical protein